MIQEQSVDNQIDEMINESKIYRFASELQHTEDESRKTSLRSILAILQRTDKTVKLEKELNARQKINDMFDKIEISALKKLWSRLNDKQKENRIKLYVSEMVMDDAKKSGYEKKLLELFETKKLKKTLIEYDEKEGKIISVDVEC
jgi:hypothetical protein